MRAEPRRGLAGGPARVVVAAGLGMGAIYLAGLRLAALVPALAARPAIDKVVAQVCALGLLYLVAAWAVTAGRGRPQEGAGLTVFVVLAGLLFRVTLLPAPPVLSSDVYRYVWDGRVQAAGINPYRHPPSAPELSPLRDEAIYPGINRKDYPTVYPGGGQLLFRLFAAAGGRSVLAFKALMTLCDAVTILLLLALLRRVGAASELVLLYAWNPLVIHEISLSGHLEGATVLLVVLAFALHLAGRRTAGIVVLAAAASLKLYPALLLPALLNRGERAKGMALFAACFAAGYLPYLGAGERVAGFLPRYFTWEYESFNLGLKALLMKLFPAVGYVAFSALLVAALGAAGLAVLLREKPPGEQVRLGALMLALMLVLMPAALHPWYVVPLVAFQVLRPSPAWIVFSCAVPLSYLKYTSAAGVVPGWVLGAEYAPLVLLLAAEFTRRRLAPGAAPPCMKEVAR